MQGLRIRPKCTLSMRAPRKLAGCKPVHMMLHPTGQDRSGTVWKAGYEQTPTRILAFMIQCRLKSGPNCCLLGLCQCREPGVWVTTSPTTPRKLQRVVRGLDLGGEPSRPVLGHRQHSGFRNSAAHLQLHVATFMHVCHESPASACSAKWATAATFIVADARPFVRSMGEGDPTSGCDSSGI